MERVVAKDMTDPAILAALRNQQEDNEEFRNRPLDLRPRQTLGNRERLVNKQSLHGIRQRFSVSIRPQRLDLLVGEKKERKTIR